MINVREKMDTWNQETYEEFVRNHYDKKIAEAAISVFDELQITDKKMNGSSCEKLPKAEEGTIGLKTTFSEFFHRETENSLFSPASYLVSILVEAQNRNISRSKYAGILSRGLRSFTSFLREPDLAIQLDDLLKNRISAYSISLNPKQDSKDHTDILIQTDNLLFRLWLYQFSSRGLPHDIERLTEKRGKLPAGIHILCPLCTQVANDYQEQKDSLLKLEDRIIRKKDKLEHCGAKAFKAKSKLSDEIENLLEEKKQKQYSVDLLKSKKEDELTEIHSWFLYSESNAKRIAEIIINTINNQQRIDTYDHVYNMLTAAEKYIGSNSIFLKEM